MATYTAEHLAADMSTIMRTAPTVEDAIHSVACLIDGVTLWSRVQGPLMVSSPTGDDLTTDANGHAVMIHDLLVFPKSGDSV